MIAATPPAWSVFKQIFAEHWDGFKRVYPRYDQRYYDEAVRGLLGYAREHGVHRFVASVGPENEPSLELVRGLGFVEVGRHWDEEDGEELELELHDPPTG